MQHSIVIRQRARRSSAFAKLPAYGCVIPWAIVVCIPLAIVVVGSVKSSLELFSDPLALPHQVQWSNFIDAWQKAALGSALFNTFLLTVCSVAGLVLFGSMAAYPLARRTGPLYKYAYLYFISGVLLPFGLSVVPLYLLMINLNLANTYQGVILLYIAGSLPLVIFLYTGFLKTIPRELEDAARIDGANRFQTFWIVIFPLLTPVTATVIIITSLGIWNDFFTPLIFLQNEENQTLQLAIRTFVGAYGENNWPLIFASLMVASLPMVVAFLFLQKYFVKGLTGGAVRG